MTLLDRIMHRWHIKVFSLFLALVLFWFYRISSLDERFISVPLELTLNEAFVPAGDYPTHVSVILRGSPEEIFSVLEDDLRVWADFSDYTAEGSYREPVFIEKRGATLQNLELEMRVEPGDLVLVQEEKLTRTLPIDPTLTGFPSLGYDMSRYFVSPSSVTIVGPRSVVERLESLTTEPIDLSGRFEEFTATSRLIYPSDLISFPGGDVVEFRGVIAESLLVQTIANIDLTLLNLNPALQLTEAVPRGNVTVQGSQAQIEALRKDDLNLLADLATLAEPGTYTVPVLPRVSGEAVLLNWQPREIRVTLEGESLGQEED